jgi:hypothetical protein
MLVGRKSSSERMRHARFTVSDNGETASLLVGEDFGRRTRVSWQLKTCGMLPAERGPLVAQSMPVTPEAIKELSKAFADIGTDELMFWPTPADLDQIDRLEDALG